MNLVDSFHTQFINNEVLNNTDFFKEFDKTELNNTIREAEIQKEIFKKIIDDIDRFLTYGKKLIEKPNFNRIQTENYVTSQNFKGNKSGFTQKY